MASTRSSVAETDRARGRPWTAVSPFRVNPRPAHRVAAREVGIRLGSTRVRHSAYEDLHALAVSSRGFSGRRHRRLQHQLQLLEVAAHLALGPPLQ